MMLGSYEFMSLQNLAEAAVRSLCMAALVGSALRVMRTRNAAARKSAWAFVLTGSMLMPFLAPLPSQNWWPLPGIRLNASGLKWLQERMEKALQRGKSAAMPPAPAPIEQAASALQKEVPLGLPAIQADSRAAAVRVRRLPALGLPATLYLAVLLLLLVRILYGLSAAIRLWREAKPLTVELAEYSAMRIRTHPRINSPVTIGSAILLPATCAAWDDQKLRMVLAHESVHVQQGDFYLQLCAELHIALFWFSPLSWWLRNTLADLSETISDGAALNAAANHVSYAQLLFEFAAQPRTTTIGVAMARPGISQRIERLLNESSFRQAFTGGPVRKVIAGAVLPASLIAATTVFHVALKAAAQTPEAPQELAAPPAAPGPTAAPQTAPEPAPEPPAPPDGPKSDRHGYWNYYDSDGNAYALVRGGQYSGSGSFDSVSNASIDQARGAAHGEFLWFSRNGKPYFIDDPAIVAQINEMYQPMELLGKQQGDLGKEQEALGREMKELTDKLTREQQIQKPDLSKEMAELNAAAAAIKAAEGTTISVDQLAAMQAKLAEVQAKLGAQQGLMGAKAGEIGAMAGKLGEMQGELGARQGRLGAEEGRLAHEIDRKVRNLIEQSLKDGKAHPVK